MSKIEKWIDNCNTLHGGYYDYSKVDFTNTKQKVDIVCPEHGVFRQQVAAHQRGQKCPQCAKQHRTKSSDEWVAEAHRVHNNYYTYDVTTYTSTSDKVRIICPEHGEFWQRADAHTLQGHGCPQCAKLSKGIAKRSTVNEWLVKAKETHGEFYDYSQVDYQGAHSPIAIVCPKHGQFMQTPANHYQGHGCSKCKCGNISHKEFLLGNYIESLGFQITRSDRGIIPPLEIDIVIPEKKICIEFNGLYWHSINGGKKHKRYHLDKLQKVEERGYQLITIFEDEWDNKQDIIKSRLKNILHMSDKGVGARHLQIKDISDNDIKTFMNTHHLQGNTSNQRIKLGAYYQNKLVGVMTFNQSRAIFGGKKQDSVYELVRFVTDGNTYSGMASKLLTAFERTYKPVKVYSYADRRFSSGRLYEKLGFTFEGNTTVGYYHLPTYTERVHRFAYTKKKLLKLYGGDSTQTEEQIAYQNGIDRIYDCGMKKFVKTY